jgi:ketosteroid isomerase-like protein
MKTLLFLLTASLLISCNSLPDPEKARQELMEADLAFSELSREKGMNHAFISYCAEDGVLLRPQSMPIEGKEAVSELILQNADTAFQLTWEPLEARVSISGDLGFTYGIFTMQLADGTATQQGTYVSVWVKEDGQWKFALDTGNQGLGDPAGL